jgi:uncharacterized membrane protein
MPRNKKKTENEVWSRRLKNNSIYNLLLTILLLFWELIFSLSANQKERYQVVFDQISRDEIKKVYKKNW